MMNKSLKTIIETFKYEGDEETKKNLENVLKSIKSVKVNKRVTSSRRLLTKVKSTSIIHKSNASATYNVSNSPLKAQKVKIDTSKLPDLRHSLNSNLKLLFVGYNPGVQSSIQQHHYAHHSNLFWKLFNQANVLQRVVQKRKKKENGMHQKVLDDDDDDDKYLKTLLSTGCSAIHDFDLIKYDIGFSDLSLRCTVRAEELTSEEKIANIPRLIREINESNAENVVLIGKGIWEVIVKFYKAQLGIKFQLNKDNFQWGQIAESKDKQYNQIIEHVYAQLPKHTTIYAFPSTSGLVASMKFSEKLRLWQEMANNL